MKLTAELASKVLEEIWGDAGPAPPYVDMSYDNAKTIGMDVSGCIPGEPVRIENGRCSTIIVSD